MDHARLVEQTMRNQGGQGGQGAGGEDGNAGGDAQAQAARNEANTRGPGQAAPEGEAVGGTAATNTAAAGTTSAQATGAVGSQVLDGVNDGLQGASGQIGNGGNSQ